MNDLDAFVRLAQALAPWTGQLVYVGGWAHRMHRLDPRANTPAHQAVFTKDTDLAFAAAEPLKGDIKAALENSGFKEQLSGESKPPAAHYSLGAEGEGFYAEFLTPLAGSGIRRNGQQDATLAKAGITAQKIRHLDILLVNPWVATLRPESAPVKTSLDIQVANPLAFMVQKFLIQKQRSPRKRAQDILYIFDTIGLFGGQVDAFHKMWNETIGPALGKSRDEVLKLNESTFSKVTDDVRNAALIPQDRKLTAEEIQSTCEFAFEQIFGAQ
ncbi:MAG TPA: GSU2403 family nucleotidyltransferase fold protein [Ramlibacter sp.]|nr:GSU2403 family nucleotidyltransferase fold protein [Ramlibacter sp.]